MLFSLYLDPVPKAVAKTCPIFPRYLYGNFRQAMKKISGIVANPWINRPNMTVRKYIPSWPTISLNDSMLTILAVTRKNTPNGDSLE